MVVVVVVLLVVVLLLLLQFNERSILLTGEMENCTFAMAIPLRGERETIIFIHAYM
jgi:hypothetical protein